MAGVADIDPVLSRWFRELNGRHFASELELSPRLVLSSRLRSAGGTFRHSCRNGADKVAISISQKHREVYGIGRPGTPSNTR